MNFADRQLRIWGFPFARSKQLFWLTRDLLQNRMRIRSFDLSDGTLAKSYDKACRFRPAYINGYTSAIQSFAQFIERTGRDGRAIGTKLVVPTAEMLYDDQRSLFQRVFGCPVMNEYGGSEIQAIAYECSAGSLHVTHENLITEVLDDSGRPVPEGTPGLLTITSLCARGVPLIRNGDLVVQREKGVCACGRHRGLSLFSFIQGRSTDVLLRADGQHTHWTTMYYAIKDAFTPGMVLEHQARQKSLDEIEVLVVRRPLYDQAAMDRFLDRMRAVVGEGVRLPVRFVDSIPREKSGKHRYFVSEIARAQLGRGDAG